MFVSSVNGVLRAQEETQRVEDIMKKIIGYNPIEITGDVKEVYTYTVYTVLVVLL